MKLKDLKPGDKLVADDGFTCITAESILTVKRWNPYKKKPSLHDLYVDCLNGHHYLSSQLDENGELIGFTRLS